MGGYGMGRVIRFRAWDKERKVMETCIDINPFHVTDCDRRRWNWAQVEVMQYTGLKDKNGREVFEGDILSVIEVSETRINEYQSQVEYIESGFLVTESNGTQVPLACFYNPENSYPLSEIEVVGNIYENPDLVNVG
jgi:uncharacterized phage protein (TIGR01671 family)